MLTLGFIYELHETFEYFMHATFAINYSKPILAEHLFYMAPGFQSVAMLSSSIDTLWGILWKRFKIHVLKNMSGWVLLNTKSLKHLGFKTFWFWKRFDIFEPDIRSIIGFSAPWNTHGVYLHICQSRQFRKKSLCRSVYTHRLVCNGTNIACS